MALPTSHPLRLERHLHQKLAAYCVRREWFALPDQIIDACRTFMTLLDGAPLVDLEPSLYADIPTGLYRAVEKAFKQISEKTDKEKKTVEKRDRKRERVLSFLGKHKCVTMSRLQQNVSSYGIRSEELQRILSTCMHHNSVRVWKQGQTTMVEWTGD